MTAAAIGRAIRAPLDGRGRRPGAIVAAGLVGAALLLAVIVTHRGKPDLQAGPARSAMIAAARQDESVGTWLGAHPADRVVVSPLDPDSHRVSFFDGPRIVLDVAVADDGRVLGEAKYPPNYVRAGDRLLNRLPVLALFAACFLLATAVAPLLRWRNLDALACVAFAGSILVINDRLLGASVVAGYVPLLYLGARCLHRALAGPDPRSAEPIYEHLTRGWPEGQRTRVLAIVTGALALIVVGTTLTSQGIGDVAIASMAGATDLVHGVLPYGHITSDVIHGDTYPLLAYAFYVPAALVVPVHDAFDNLDGGLWIAALASLATGIALWRAAPGRAGLRLAIAWFAFAPAVLTAASGSNDLVIAAWLACALLAMRRAGLSALLLTVAGWVKVVPLLLLPLWAAGRRPAGLVRIAAAACAVTLGVLAWLVALGGPDGVVSMLDGLRFQQQRGSLISIWAATGTEPLREVGQATALGAVALLTALAWRGPAPWQDSARLAGFVAAALVVLQAGANYWSFAYLTWAFPPIALALFADRVAAERA